MNDADPVVRLAFLGALQVLRGGGWPVAVRRRTPNVLPSLCVARGVRILAREVAALDEAAPVELRLVGYSWGAWSAIKVVDRLLRGGGDLPRGLHGRRWRIRLGLLDPVATGRTLASLPDHRDLVAWNVYQRNGCHRGCPGLSRWYRGLAVAGARNLDVTLEGRRHPPRNGVPPEKAPDHIQLGYRSWGRWDERVAAVLDGDVPFPAVSEPERSVMERSVMERSVLESRGAQCPRDRH